MASKEEMHQRIGKASESREIPGGISRLLVDILTVLHQIVERLPDNEEDKK
jgi:hypothetical protein